MHKILLIIVVISLNKYIGTDSCNVQLLLLYGFKFEFVWERKSELSQMTSRNSCFVQEALKFFNKLHKKKFTVI